MKSILSLTVAALMLCLSGTVQADTDEATSGVETASNEKCSTEKCSTEKCSSETCTAEECSGEKCSADKARLAKRDRSKCNPLADADPNCPVTQAMADLPRMKFLVGERKFSCEHAAGAVAKRKESEVRFLVATKSFDLRDDAMVALADETEKFVAEFATPHTCSVSGNTTVAGTSTTCSATAGKLASITKEAMSNVTLAYKVGDEQCSCPNHAASLAEASGKEKQFVIGDETTSCAVDARIKLAHAKYAAAVKALLANQEQEAAPKG